MKFISFLTRLFIVIFCLGVAWAGLTYLSGRFVTDTVIKSSSVLFPAFNNSPVPEISAKHIFILDRHSGVVLYQKDADAEIYPASTTKMMTAIVAYTKLGLDQVITVNQTYPEGVDINLIPGERLKVSDLLYAILVPSANDAAEVLAAGYPGGRQAFVAAMNSQATNLRLHHTFFLNPTGLDQPGHYSSAADLARIADYLLDIPYLSKIVSTQNAVISSADYSVFHSLSNVNQLLGKIPGVVGIKTGFTDLAGESVVTLVNRDGHEIILSVLGSTDRFADTQLLIDWIFSSFVWGSPPPYMPDQLPEHKP